jgi:hypothetical protein
MKFHTGYYLSLHREDNQTFTLEDYSERLIHQSSLKLKPSNYEGSNWAIEWIYSEYWQGLEFIIIADSFEIAQNVLFNLLCSSSVIEGTVNISGEPHYPHPLGTIENIKGMELITKPIVGLSNSSIPIYFKLASEASKDIKLENAITKYHISTEIYSMHYMDLAEVDWKITGYCYWQMKFAYAIISAYSVIEELGLNIRANKEKPSKLSGEWNPEVLNDLIKRLKSSNINVNDPISWMVRGHDTKIEKKNPIKIVKKAEWSNPPGYEDEFLLTINDGYIFIQDAINYVSLLRSKIASHEVGTRIMDLSVFDVANSQFLARQLILEKSNLWKLLSNH